MSMYETHLFFKCETNVLMLAKHFKNYFVMTYDIEMGYDILNYYLIYF